MAGFTVTRRGISADHSYGRGAASGAVALPTPSGSAATDIANLNAAVGGGARTLVGSPGTYQLNAQVVIPTGVDLWCAGSAQGASANSATVFQCTTAGAGLKFLGDAGLSGNLEIDGDNIATQPFIRGDASGGSQRQFSSLVVRHAAQDNMTIQYAQNDLYINCVCSGAARDNQVFDAGTGGHIFINQENAGHGRYGIHFQQTVDTHIASYSVPAQIQFYGGRTEGGTAATTGAALQVDNGYHITFDNHDLNHGTGAVAAIGNVITASTALNQVNTGNIVFRDIWWTGGAATTKGLHVDGVSNATIDGGEFKMAQGALDLASGAGLFIVKLPFTFSGPLFSAATPVSAIVGVTKPGPTDTVWTAPTLANAWVNIGSGFDTAGYRKDGQGYVHLRGVIASGTTTAGTTLFTLPAGYRPSASTSFPAASTALGEVRVSSAGVVTIQQGANTYLSLDGITFLAEN